MSLTLFEVTVPLFVRGLTGLSWVLAKAETHYREGGLDTAELMSDGLSPDMFPLPVQIAMSVNHSLGALDRLSGKGDSLQGPSSTLADARKVVADALASVQAVTPADLVGAEGRAINWDPMKNGGMSFDDGLTYALTFAVPNFYFHSTTAYAIVRKNGVAIGKRDFMARGEAPAGILPRRP